jgi:hypothetical protein
MAPYPLQGGPIVDSMLGVPVVVGLDNAALPLGPRDWRLVNRDGAVLKSGTLDE